MVKLGDFGLSVLKGKSDKVGSRPRFSLRSSLSIYVSIYLLSLTSVSLSSVYEYLFLYLFAHLNVHIYTNNVYMCAYARMQVTAGIAGTPGFLAPEMYVIQHRETQRYIRNMFCKT